MVDAKELESLTPLHVKRHIAAFGSLNRVISRIFA